MLVLRFRYLRGPWPAAAVCLLAVLVVGLVLSGCRPETPLSVAEPGVPGPQIRVKIGEDQASRLVSVLDEYQIYDMRSRRLISAGDELAGARFAAQGNTLLLNGGLLETDRVIIVPQHSDEGKLDLGGATFRGKLRVIAAGGKVSLINIVFLEDYLGSVVGKELYSRDWHIETHKAQAIAARSFALYHMKNTPPSRQFDVYDSSNRSQAYQEGTAAETEKSRHAVKATRGVVLTFDDGGTDRIFEVFYHSTCGGRTVPVQQYFTSAKAIKPLGGVKCNYCGQSKHFRWQYRFSAEQLRKNLLKTTSGMEGLDRIGRIEVLELEEDRTADGRVKIISVWTPEAESARWPVPVGVFKKQFPPDAKFKTDRFAVRIDGSDVVVVGRGFGHGIGMCQYGAEEQARRGRRAGGILNYYYPGSKLVRVY